MTYNELMMECEIVKAKMAALDEWEAALQAGEEFEPWFDVDQELFYIEEEIRNPLMPDPEWILNDPYEDDYSSVQRSA